MSEGDEMITAEIRIEYIHDPDTEGWAFRVPSLNITGVGCLDRAEAQHTAAEAIAFALEEDGGAGDHVRVAIG